MGGIEKFSFHASGICRHAFTEEEGPGDGEMDRVLQRWQREVPVPAGALVLPNSRRLIRCIARPQGQSQLAASFMQSA